MAKEEIDFNGTETIVLEKEMTPDDFNKGGKFIKADDNKELIFVVEKVVNNPETTGVNKTTGATFGIGLKKKDGTYLRYDIHSDLGVFTIVPWEVYFKLIPGVDNKPGLLTQYALKHNKSYKGAQVSIKRLYNAKHANYNDNDLAKILGVDVEQAAKYKAQVAKAMKEQGLYEVKVLNLE